MRFTDTNFEQEVLNSNIPVFVDFWASWCLPCKMTEPIIDKLDIHFNGKIKIGKINVDQNPKTISRYGLKGVPTFAVFVDGKIVDRKVGAHSESQLIKMIEDATL